MTRIDLDFLSPGARPGPVSWLLLALGLAAVGVVASAWNSADADARAAQAHIALLDRAPAAKSKQSEKKIDSALQARDKEDAQARRALALPWNRLLTTLQDGLPDDVALVSLDVDGRRGDFQIVANAKSHQAMLDYYRELQGESGFGKVTLTRHELREIDGLQGVNFSLRGDWTGEVGKRGESGGRP